MKSNDDFFTAICTIFLLKSFTRKGQRFMSYLEPVPDENGIDMPNVYEALFVTNIEVQAEFSYFGSYDEDGQFHGQAILNFSNQKMCYKGDCDDIKISQIFLTFVHGVVEVKITSKDFIDVKSN